MAQYWDEVMTSSEADIYHTVIAFCSSSAQLTPSPAHFCKLTSVRDMVAALKVINRH